MTEGYALFTADISAQSVNSFINFLAAQALAKIQKLTIGMSSQGGRVNEGITLYNVLSAMPYETVIHNTGNVDSISNVIFLAGKQRYACPASTFMFHSVGFDFDGKHRLEEKNLRELLDSVEADHRRICTIIEAKTKKIPIAEGIKLFQEQRTKDAAWAKDKGFITDIREFTFPLGHQVQQFA